MELVQSLANRLQELYLDGKWATNTNYKYLLVSTIFSEATKVIHGRNSIALLTFHINYYLKGLNEAFSTYELNIRDQFS